MCAKFHCPNSATTVVESTSLKAKKRPGLNRVNGTGEIRPTSVNSNTQGTRKFVRISGCSNYRTNSVSI